MTIARTVARLVALLVAAGVCVTAAVGSAAASEATPSAPSVDLLVSVDGIHYSSALDGGLFDGSGRLVPGESVASDLWIRNPTSVPAEVRVSARNVTASTSDFADAMTMDAWDSGTNDTRSRSLSALAECEIVVPAQQIAAGATLKTLVRFTMTDLGGVSGQGEEAGLDLMVAMRDAEAGPFPASACDDDGVLITSKPARPSSQVSPSSLATTGTNFAVPLLASGGFLVGIGLFLVAGRRRNRNES